MICDCRRRLHGEARQSTRPYRAYLQPPLTTPTPGHTLVHAIGSVRGLACNFPFFFFFGRWAKTCIDAEFVQEPRRFRWSQHLQPSFCTKQVMSREVSPLSTVAEAPPGQHSSNYAAPKTAQGRKIR
jgi:hypothetical protein